jgi:hypothetical protein
VWGIVFSFCGQVYAQPVWQPQIVADTVRLYEPVARAQRLAFDFQIPLDQMDLVASAHNDGVTAIVRIDGGVLASPRLTPDSLRITVCHELGHIFGGATRRNVPLEWDGARAADGKSLLSAEGQADYYATLVCFRKMVEGQDHRAALEGRVVPAVAKAKCERSWGADSEEALVCERAFVGSLDFLNFVKDFPIALEASAPEIAEEPIIDMYPSRQCRLDTLVAGALCRSRFPLQLDRDRPGSSDCPQLEARRPSCWCPHNDFMASL